MGEHLKASAGGVLGRQRWVRHCLTRVRRSLSSCLKSTAAQACARHRCCCAWPVVVAKVPARARGESTGSLPAAERRRPRKSTAPRIGKVCTIPFYPHPCALLFRHVGSPHDLPRITARMNLEYPATPRSRKTNVRRLAAPSFPVTFSSPLAAKVQKKREYTARRSSWRSSTLITTVRNTHSWGASPPSATTGCCSSDAILVIPVGRE
jgi:hypothetical protein